MLTINVAVLPVVIVVLRLRRRTESRSRFGRLVGGVSRAGR
ncbi:hypothetical protein ABTX80_31885 [Streptomyces erythrochromogenes]